MLMLEVSLKFSFEAHPTNEFHFKMKEQAVLWLLVFYLIPQRALDTIAFTRL